MFGMDEGRIPRKNADALGLKEARRLFYVGFTRTESELHLIFSANSPSRFVSEVQQRLEE
jgi:ATP-dependent DNA helicase UvrD/PcrA